MVSVLNKQTKADVHPYENMVARKCSEQSEKGCGKQSDNKVKTQLKIHKSMFPF